MVSNIARHAHAKKADVALHFKKGAIAVHIRDDREGFDVEEALSSRDRQRGLGLLGMRERTELMKGTLSIRSHHGKGTEVAIEIPINDEAFSG